MDGDHITIWGTEDEHAVFGKFIKIVDGSARKTPRAAGTISSNRLGTLTQIEAERAAGSRAGSAAAEKAAVEEYRGTLRARERDAAEKARDEASEARDRAMEMRERSSELAEQRKELEQAAKTLRSRSEALQSESRTTEQRVRDLERLVAQMEERAQRIEQQLNAQDSRPFKARKSNTSPGMLAPAAPVPRSCPQYRKSWTPPLPAENTSDSQVAQAAHHTVVQALNRSPHLRSGQAAWARID